MSEYFKTWYEKNKESLLSKRKQRYRNDPEYAEKCRAVARDYKKTNAPKSESNGEKTSRSRGPVKFQINGRNVQGHTISHLAKRCDKTVQTIRNWTKAGIIPETPIKTDSGHRLYTEGMVFAVVRALTGFVTVRDDGMKKRIRSSIKDGWASCGVIIE